MKEVAVHEAKTRLSELLAEVESGEQVVITRRGVAVEKLVAGLPLAPRPVLERRTSASVARPAITP